MKGEEEAGQRRDKRGAHSGGEGKTRGFLGRKKNKQNTTTIKPHERTEPKGAADGYESGRQRDHLEEDDDHRDAAVGRLGGHLVFVCAMKNAHNSAAARGGKVRQYR